MDQSPDGRGELGPGFRAPSFLPPAPAPEAPPAAFGSAPPPVPGPWPPVGQPGGPGQPAHPGSRLGSHLPAVITALVVFVVVAVVVAGTAVARYADTHVAAPVVPSRVAPPLPQVSPSSQVVLGDDRIDFITSEGTGQLVLVHWSWTQTGRQPPLSGDYLQVEIELVCSTGMVTYSPDNFQAFDSNGFQVDVSNDGLDGPVLEMGTLQAGEHVRGAIAFDMARGAATLLMSDGLDETVTALKIPQ